MLDPQGLSFTCPRTDTGFKCLSCPHYTLYWGLFIYKLPLSLQNPTARSFQASLPSSSWGQPPQPSGWSSRSPQIFTKKTGPAVNSHFLALASAWPLRAQCTHNYNVIAQAGAHGEHRRRGRRTPGARSYKGHSEAAGARIYIFSRGGRNTVSMKIAFWIMAGESFGGGLWKACLSFFQKERFFPPRGFEKDAGREGGRCFCSLMLL